MNDQAAAEREIVDIHVFFADWFTGRCEKSEDIFEDRLTSRFTDDFLYVMPGGAKLSVADLRSGMYEMHGSNPDFRIAIREVQVRCADAETVVAFYEEWQRGAKASKPADNGRMSTVVFVRDGARLRWAHLHETWMTPEAMAAGDFDF